VTTDQRFSVLIATLGLIFVVMSAILGFVVKVSMTWGKTTEQLQNVVTDLGELKDEFAHDVSEVILAKERDHTEIRERLTFLERRELNQRRKSDSS